MSAAPDLPQRHRTTHEFVIAGRIQADPLYQRPLDHRRVARMAESFDADAFGIPFVFEDDHGHLWVIDGQHRIAAAIVCFGEAQEMECEIIRGITRQQAAALFRLRNASRKVRPLDEFRAAVVAREEEAVAITKIVHSVGLEIADSQGRSSCIRAVSALQRVYRGDRMLGNGRNGLTLKRVLVTLHDAWPGEAESFNAALIQGLGLVMQKYGNAVDVAEMVKKLKGYAGGPMKMLGDARGFRQTFGGSVAEGVAATLVMLYNRGRRSKKLANWRASESEE